MIESTKMERMQFQTRVTIEAEVMPCPSHPGYYATKDGRVISSRNKSGGMARELSPAIMNKGYLTVSLTLDGEPAKTFMLSHIIAEAFLGPKPEGARVIFLDKNILNCAPDNLAYKPVGVGCKLCADDILHIRRLYSQGVKNADLATQFNVSLNHMYCITSNRTWKHIVTEEK